MRNEGLSTLSAEILIVDDNQLNVKLLEMILKGAGYRARTATSGKQALKAVAEFHPTAILLDINMPEMDGYEVCRALQDDERTRSIPVIFMSAGNEVDYKTKAFKEGGRDYITKPFQSKEVIARVNTHITLARMQTELEEANKKLREMAVRDPLTGLYNRRYLDEFLAHEVARAERAATPISFLMIDLDHFKRINDTHGHEAGDMVLQAVAAEIQKTFRGSDIVCRFGGEEFLVVMPEAGMDAATGRAETLRTSISKLQTSVTGSPPISVTVSIGVSCFPIHGDSTGAVLKSADMALYEAKKSGRDRVCKPD